MSGRPRPELEHHRQAALPRRHRTGARGDRSASQPADEANTDRFARGAGHMHHQLAPA